MNNKIYQKKALPWAYIAIVSYLKLKIVHNSFTPSRHLLCNVHTNYTLQVGTIGMQGFGKERWVVIPIEMIDALLYFNLSAILKNIYFCFRSLQLKEQMVFNRIGEVRITVSRTSPFLIFSCLQHQ
jgi:hypothetical protein